jgi:hypothetical protein
MLLEFVRDCNCSGAEQVEPARPFGQRILSPVIAVLPDLTK